VPRLVDKLKDLLWIRTGGPGPASAPRGGVVSRVVATSEGAAKLHLRSLPDGSSILVVDGHFLVRLNRTSHLILAMKLEGKSDDAILAEMSKSFTGASPGSIREDIEKTGGFLDRLRKEGPGKMAGEHAGNLFTSPLTAAVPLRADLQTRDPVSGRPLTKSDGHAFIERLHAGGVIAVRFISFGSLQDTPIVDLVERTQDLGLIAGLMMKGREAIDRTLLKGLVAAGIDYFEIPLFSDLRAEHEQIEGTNSLAADFEGLRMILGMPEEAAVIVAFPILSTNIDAIESTLKTLHRYGVRHVKVGALLVPDKLKDEERFGVTLQEYEHTVVVVERLAADLDLSYVLSSPLWMRGSNPSDVGGWGWACTASENALFVTVDGSLHPCLHARQKLGRLADAGPAPLPSPLGALTDLPPEEVDYVRLCRGCRDRP